MYPRSGYNYPDGPYGDWGRNQTPPVWVDRDREYREREQRDRDAAIKAAYEDGRKRAEMERNFPPPSAATKPRKQEADNRKQSPPEKKQFNRYPSDRCPHLDYNARTYMTHERLLKCASLTKDFKPGRIMTAHDIEQALREQLHRQDHIFCSVSKLDPKNSQGPCTIPHFVNFGGLAFKAYRENLPRYMEATTDDEVDTANVHFVADLIQDIGVNIDDVVKQVRVNTATKRYQMIPKLGRAKRSKTSDDDDSEDKAPKDGGFPHQEFAAMCNKIAALSATVEQLATRPPQQVVHVPAPAPAQPAQHQPLPTPVDPAVAAAATAARKEELLQQKAEKERYVKVRKEYSRINSMLLSAAPDKLPEIKKNLHTIFDNSIPAATRLDYWFKKWMIGTKSADGSDIYLLKAPELNRVVKILDQKVPDQVGTANKHIKKTDTEAIEAIIDCITETSMSINDIPDYDTAANISLGPEDINA
mmetsp:Transcript_12267/g.20270  ORF Transcript_12267/g.20270 Transcript_12267/m.20270 type:complete len:474 (+) Transcript_12267:121-1542(+)